MTRNATHNASGNVPDTTTVTQPFGVMELTTHGLGLSDVCDIGAYVTTHVTRHTDETDDTLKQRIARVNNRIRNAGRNRDAIGTIVGAVTVSDDGVSRPVPAYAYRVFGDTWVMPTRTTLFPNVIADTVTRTTGRADGTRKLVVYATPAQYVALCNAIATITGNDTDAIRYANDTRGNVWLSVVDNAVVETVDTDIPDTTV